jgi:hypothetical protein
MSQSKHAMRKRRYRAHLQKSKTSLQVITIIYNNMYLLFFVVSILELVQPVYLAVD